MAIWPYVYVRIIIIFPTTGKTERKPCSVRVRIMDLRMVSERDFDNMTCV